ncbi:hypothetical protein HF313_10095 [Massilia atriviolacea]|uniref:DUF2059 domain-containing protein n=1 Tax=Massilia atriviolacea TaxID=2495579 RepID=A0A430HI63_9BURK|nr:hypothetical protein [Massilia atriviolacea]RSZ57190.1 hypothetical protein EJB06_20955 [Massilia atriviolacea]
MLSLPAAVMLSGAAQAQAVNAATAAVFSKPALLGVQLSMKAGARQGKVTPEQLKCVQGLDPASFDEVFKELLASNLDGKELMRTQSFLAKSVGKKFAKHGYLGVFAAAGEPLPEALPRFTEDEMVDFEQFRTSSAGEKLVTNRVLEAPAARTVLNARIEKVLEVCVPQQ